MEENKKVFIRGCKGRGSEVKDFLTGLGAKVPKYEFGINDGCIYFIDHDNKISTALADSEIGAIIMDNYKEIELPPLPWKDGDILVDSNYPGNYSVFKKYNNYGTFEAYFFLEGKTALFDNTAYVEGYHLASEKEMKNLPPLFSLLMGALNNAGLCLPKKV